MNTLIRITRDDFHDKIIAWLESYIPGKLFFMVREIGEATKKPHYQIYIPEKLDATNMKRSLNAKLDLHGNEDMSVSNKKVSSGINYLCKSESPNHPPPTVWWTNMPDIDQTSVDVGHMQFWTSDYARKKYPHFFASSTQPSPQSDLAESTQSHPQKKKPTFLDVVEREFNIYLRARKDNDPRFDPKNLSRRELGSWLLEQFVVMRKLFDTPTVKKYVNWLEYKVDPEYFKQKFLSDI